jgi:hypothetical protein
MTTYFDLSQYEDPMEEVFFGEDFKKVTQASVYEQSRWTTYKEQVFQYKDGTFWEATWAEGSTEMQECDPELTLLLVEPKQVTQTIYEEV